MFDQVSELTAIIRRNQDLRPEELAIELYNHNVRAMPEVLVDQEGLELPFGIQPETLEYIQVQTLQGFASYQRSLGLVDAARETEKFAKGLKNET